MDSKKSKRHDMKWAQRKTGTHKRGKEDDKREKTREDEYQEICDNLAYLGDPYDDMDLEQKKVDCIVEKHGRSRATLQHTWEKMDQIVCGPIVCENCFCAVIIGFEKIDEVKRKFPMCQNCPDPSMDYWGKCS